MNNDYFAVLLFLHIGKNGLRAQEHPFQVLPLFADRSY
jgi:hypothetical protein